MTDKTEPPIDFEAARRESVARTTDGLLTYDELGGKNLARAYLSLAAEMERLRAENAALRAKVDDEIRRGNRVADFALENYAATHMQTDEVWQLIKEKRARR